MSAARDLTGRVVFVEREVPTKGDSSYYDGEYIVLRQTENQLFGLPLSGNYAGISTYGLGGHSASKQIPLIGSGRYRILSDSPIPDWVATSLDEVERDVNAVLNGEKKASWVDSVYHNARANIHRLRQVLAEQQPKTTRVCLPPKVVSVYVPEGVRVEVFSR